MKDFYFSDEEDAKEFLLKNKWLINSLIVLLSLGKFISFSKASSFFLKLLKL